MYATTLLLAGAILGGVVSAGPHSHHFDRSKIRTVHRRHHAKRATSGCNGDGSESISTSSTTTGSCSNGTWQCVGPSLQLCDHDSWVTMTNCTGTDIICSASGAVGCVWSGSANSSTISNSTSSTVTTNTTTINPKTSTGSTNSTDPSDDGDDDVNCDGEDAENDSVTTSVTPPATSSTGSSSTSITVTAYNGSSIGGALYAPGSQSQNDSSSTSGRATKTFGTAAPTTSTIMSDAGYGASSASSGFTTVPTTASTKKGKGKGHSSTASVVSATASASGISSNSTTDTNSTTTSGGTFAAPHWVVYADNWLNTMPAVSELASYNRFILAFWMSNSGAVDDAEAWAGFDQSYRDQVLQEYHAAGIALMVSAFGSTDSPTTWGMDPTETAQQLASWVKQYELDGVDIDYEDMTAMNNNQAEAWLITFQTELRNQLPSPYLISHAPVAPWFTSANDYQSGAYVKIHQEVGDGIDFYNVQFYNQGDNAYTDCNSLVFDSGSDWPSTSIMELNSYAQVPLEKIVIGKPMDQGAADNGYIDPSTLSQCVQQAQAKGWNGGVMFWEWTSQGPAVMSTVRG